LKLDHIAGSKNWHSKADHGIVLSKVKWADHVTEFQVQKSKDWETMGTPGKAYMCFIRAKGTFKVLSGELVAEYKDAYKNRDKLILEEITEKQNGAECEAPNESGKKLHS
jgi:hypothetical protein